MRSRALLLLLSSLTLAALAVGAPVRADDADDQPAPPPQAKTDDAAPQDKPDDQAPKTPEQARADLYARLAAAKDGDETAGIITLLLRAYAESGSTPPTFCSNGPGRRSARRNIPTR